MGEDLRLGSRRVGARGLGPRPSRCYRWQPILPTYRLSMVIHTPDRKKVREFLRAYLPIAAGILLTIVIAPVVGEFFVKWAEESGWYANPSRTVGGIMSSVVAFVTQTWFLMLTSLVVGLAAGVRVDFLLRRDGGSTDDQGRPIDRNALAIEADELASGIAALLGEYNGRAQIAWNEDSETTMRSGVAPSFAKQGQADAWLMERYGERFHKRVWTVAIQFVDGRARHLKLFTESAEHARYFPHRQVLRPVAKELRNVSSGHSHCLRQLTARHFLGVEETQNHGLDMSHCVLFGQFNLIAILCHVKPPHTHAPGTFPAALATLSAARAKSSGSAFRFFLTAAVAAKNVLLPRMEPSTP